MSFAAFAMLGVTVAAFFAVIYAVHKFISLTDAREKRQHESRMAVLNRTQSAAPEASETRKVSLPVTQAQVQRGLLDGKCGTCVHFDIELGQREMQRNPSFVAAAAAVPPWRMGRALKLDADGNPLPMNEQGVSREMLNLEWRDMGACTCPSKEEQVIQAKIDTCAEYARAETGVSA